MDAEHVPVLVPEVLELMQIKPGDVVVDCNLGFGGHSKYFLDKLEGRGYLIGIDRDIEAVGYCRKNFEEYQKNLS